MAWAGVFKGTPAQAMRGITRSRCGYFLAM
jgi:hypothetical protein